MIDRNTNTNSSYIDITIMTCVCVTEKRKLIFFLKGLIMKYAGLETVGIIKLRNVAVGNFLIRNFISFHSSHRNV